MRLTKTSLAILFIISLAAADQFLSGWQNHTWPLLAATWLLLLLAERSMLWRQKISVQRRLNQYLYMGRPASITYCLTNHATYPVRICTQDMLPSSLQTEKKCLQWNLCAQQQIQQVSTATPVAPAELTFTHLRLMILGRLALAWWPRNLAIPQTVKVVPDYRGTSNLTRRAAKDFLSASKLHAYQSVTLVLNAGYLNQIVSGDLRRIDHYLNACSRLAYRALTARRALNIIIYGNELKLVMRNVNTLAQLGRFFTRLRHIDTESMANHRCVLPQLASIHQPGLLVWYTDLDETQSNLDLAKILTQAKQRFAVQVSSLVARESALLDTDLNKRHCSPYHKLEILTTQQQWEDSRQLLRRVAIPVVSA